MGTEFTTSERARSLGILFVAGSAALVDVCLQQLQEAQFSASADLVLTPTQCAEKLRARPYDLVVAEYPNKSWSGSRDLRLFRQAVQEVPLLFLTADGNASVAELTAHGEFDYLERAHVARLPGTVRRILNEKTLRMEREEAEKALRHSQSQYHALADNPDYGILQCDAEGKFLDVNNALVTMLGYANREELLTASRASDILLDGGLMVPLTSQPRESNGIVSGEVEWERKNGTIMRGKLSGGAVHAEDGRLTKYELIVVDLTRQQERENQLRRQALSDPLTGLGNRRSLFEALHGELRRYNRSKREFSFVLLDLDGLKEINDRLGHGAGDRALCRLALVLTDCSRAVDTLARHGGDEFALILPETDVAPAQVVARRICTMLASDPEEPGLSVSFGIAGFPKDANSIPALIRAADVAMYTMKRTRRQNNRMARVS